MKKTMIFSFVALLVLPTISKAQSKALDLTPTGDTLNATSAADTSIAAANSVGYYSTITFTAVVKKVSGTVTGIALLQFSNDGANWFDLGTDTLTITNQAVNKKAWTVSPHIYRNYRVWTRLATGIAVPRVAGYFNKPKDY